MPSSSYRTCGAAVAGASSNDDDGQGGNVVSRRRRRRQPRHYRLLCRARVTVALTAATAAFTATVVLGSAASSGASAQEDPPPTAVKIEAVSSAELTGEGGEDESSSSSSCRILALFPLSEPFVSGDDEIIHNNGGGHDEGNALLRSALLAVRHFNDRDPAVVPELAAPEFATSDAAAVVDGVRDGDGNDTSSGGCSVRLSLSAFDSRRYYYEDPPHEPSSAFSVEGGSAEGAGMMPGGIEDAIAAVTTSARGGRSSHSSPPPCAVLGRPSFLSSPSGRGSATDDPATTTAKTMMSPVDALSGQGLSSLTAALGLTRVLPSGSSLGSFSSSFSSSVSTSEEETLYLRKYSPVSLDASPSSYGAAAVSYLTSAELDRRYVTLLYDGTDGVGEGIKKGAAREASKDDDDGSRNVVSDWKEVPYMPSPSDEGARRTPLEPGTVRSVRNALLDVSMIGYRTIVLVPSPSSDPSLFLPLIASEADGAGLLDGERLWIVPDASGSMSEYVRACAEEGPTGATGRRSALDRLLGGMAIVRTADGFEVAGAGEQGGGRKFLDMWSSIDASEETLGGRNGDASDASANGEDAPAPPLPPPPRATFVYDSILALGMGLCRHINAPTSGISSTPAEAIRTVSFRGASGNVSFKDWTGERSKNGTVFGIYNVRRVVKKVKGSKEDSEVSYRLVLTSTGTPDGVWSHVAGEHFLYASGSRFPPHLLRDDQSPSFLSPSAHYAGLSLMSISLATSAASALWVYAKRRTRIVRSAQPQFLYLLCFGSMVMASSIAFMSYDESFGWSQDQLNAACVAFPWLFTMGYIVIYASLYMKLLRIHRVMQIKFRKKKHKIRLRRLGWRFALLILSAAIVLTVWTVVDPFTWVRETISEMPPRTCGLCMSSKGWAYVIPLAVIMFVATALTAYIAWKARDIPSEFQESSWIYYGVFVHIQSWIVSIPVLVIVQPAHNNADTAYLGRALIMFAFSVSMVLVIIGPKMYVVFRKRISGDTSVKSKKSRADLVKVGSGDVKVSGLKDGLPRSCSTDTVTNNNERQSNSSLTPSSLYEVADDSFPSTRSLTPSKMEESFTNEVHSINGEGDDSPSESSLNGKIKSVRFYDDALEESKRLVISLETANSRLQQDLEQSVTSLVEKEMELEEASQRILVLEQNTRENDEVLIDSVHSI